MTYCHLLVAYLPSLCLDEAVLAAAAMSRLGRAKTRPLLVLRSFLQGLRPIVEEEERFLDEDQDLISFRIWDDSFPTWVTEKLRLSDWPSLTRSVCLRATVNIDLATECHGCLLSISPTRKAKISRHFGFMTSKSSTSCLSVRPRYAG